MTLYVVLYNEQTDESLGLFTSRRLAEELVAGRLQNGLPESRIRIVEIEGRV